MGKYPPPMLDLPPEHDTPFHVWMNAAVDEVMLALGGQYDPRIHFYRCFNALLNAWEEKVKAHKLER